MTKFVKDSDNEREKDFIFKDNKKTKFGATFIVIVLVILVVAVIASLVYFEVV